MNDDHLSKLFSKPKDGEYVPITFVEFRQRLVGWSPELRRSMYVEKEDDEEKLQFEEVYSHFLRKGGQLMYTRKKLGARTVSFFELREAEKRAIDTPGKSLLSDRI